MKKILALVLALLMMTVMFAACGEKDDNNADDTAVDANGNKTEMTDLEYVLDKGVLVVGITDFAPMDYEDENGNWVGFDADMAKAFAESLGVEVEFVEIEWGSKVMELDGKTIDCVWNGMTLTDEVKAAMECSKPYCNNAQVVIVNKDVADNYKTADDCKELNFAVEDGSAGEDMAVENGFTYTAVIDQATALFEVSSGTCDAAIIDSLMAAAMVGEDTGYEGLTYTVSLNSEEYGVGFRKGSELAEKLNAFFDAALADGSMEECAETYGVQAALIK